MDLLDGSPGPPGSVDHPDHMDYPNQMDQMEHLGHLPFERRPSYSTGDRDIRRSQKKMPFSPSSYFHRYKKSPYKISFLSYFHKCDTFSGATFQTYGLCYRFVSAANNEKHNISLCIFFFRSTIMPDNGYG